MINVNHKLWTYKHNLLVIIMILIILIILMILMIQPILMVLMIIHYKVVQIFWYF